METLTELETKLKEIQTECNNDWYSLGIKTYALSELPEDIEELKTRLRNKNIEAQKLKEKIDKLTPPKKLTVAPEVPNDLF